MFKQKGVALIIVLMVVALVSVLATEMGGRLQLQIKRTANIKDNNQAYWYAMGAEQFARQSIELLMKNSNNVIHLNQQWNEEFAYPLEGGGIQARLVDMQSCFNLNAVHTNTNPGASTGNPPVNLAKQAFKDMLNKAELEVSSFSADTLSDALADWLDQDDNMLPYGAEDAEYESLSNPYLAANGLMTSKSELRLIKGVDQAWLLDLMPLVCVVPGNSELKININTLDENKAAILAGLTGLSLSDAKSEIAAIPQNGYKKPNDFLGQARIAALALSDDKKAWFVTDTQHFILHTKTRYNNATFMMSSVLKVDSGNKVSVVRREFGGVL